MRTALPLVLALAAPAAHAAGCNCFPPEAQAQTARETLRIAHAAYFGRVQSVTPAGGARLLVLESFKGPAAGAVAEVAPKAAACEAAPFEAGEEVLMLAFDETPNACDKHPREHYLLDALRAVVAPPRLELTSPPAPPAAPPRR